MIASELKLAGLEHCYIELPASFVNNNPEIRSGAIISIRSVQNDIEMFAMWNGQFSPDGKAARIDMFFAKANRFEDELVVLHFINDRQPQELSLCRVELIEAADHEIISQHLSANVLDTCRLVSRDLIIPIRLSRHVKISVRVDFMTPDSELALLTQSTEMQFLTPNTESNRTLVPEDESLIMEPIASISCTLGVDFSPKFYMGSILICGEKGSGKTHLLGSIIRDYRRFKSEIIDCKQFRAKRPEAIKKKLGELLTNALRDQPFIIGLDDIQSIVSHDTNKEDERGQEAIYQKRLVDILCHLFKQIERSERRRVVIIATCRSLDSLDPRLSKPSGRKFFNETIQIDRPNQNKRAEILKSIILEHTRISSSLNDPQIDKIAKLCESYLPSDLRKLVERSITNACSRSLLAFNTDPLNLKEQDLIDALDGYIPYSLRGVALQRKTTASFDTIGGMQQIKDLLIKTVLRPVKYPLLYRKCPMKPQNSILLYGPPGCGKTLIGEALTNQVGINSICVKGPELLSKYIGASEAAVRDLFKRAELAKPCVIFFDEFESLVSKRGSDSTGVTDRVVNQFLTLMDGVEKMSEGIFIIATTSRPDIIDPAIMRPGRLDKLVYCPPPDTQERLEILKVLSKGIKIENQGDSLKNLSGRLKNFTGADIQSLLYSAQLKALHDIIDQKGRNYEKTSKLDIIVENQHLQRAYDEMVTDVRSRYGKFKTQYPREINRNHEQTSLRATLA